MFRGFTSAFDIAFSQGVHDFFKFGKFMEIRILNFKVVGKLGNKVELGLYFCMCPKKIKQLFFDFLLS